MESRFILILFFTFIFFLFFHPIGVDGDIYHHLHTGKYIVENLSLPRFDEWTFTAHGQSWIAHSWASGILFYLIYTYFGVFGISILTALIGILSILLIFILLKSYQIKNIFIFPLLLLITSIFLIRFPPRPEIFTYPLLVSILLINKLNKPKLYLLYPPIIFLWSIFYGANVFVGLGLLIFLAYSKARKPVLISILISLFNGYGLDTIFYFLKISNISQYQGEWMGIFSLLQKAPPQYFELFKFRLAIYSIFVLLYVILLLTSLKMVRKYLWEFLLGLGVLLPFFTFRQVPLAASLSLPYLSVILARQTQNLYLKLSIWVLALLSIAVTLIYNFPSIQLSEDPSRIRLASFISDNNLSGKAYTNQQIGSFLSFKFYPKILVSYDTRDDLFLGGRFLNDILSPTPLELILNRYKADLVILDTYEDSQKANYLINSPNWIKLYFEDNFLVMKRKQP